MGDASPCHPSSQNVVFVVQLVNMERRMLVYSFPSASIPAARSFYRAAAELIQKTLDANASPNGEAAVGSQQYKNLMEAMSSFLRIMSSWAQLEFTHRYTALP